MTKSAPTKKRPVTKIEPAVRPRDSLSTSGLFLNPFLPAAQIPSLRISVANGDTGPASANVVVNTLDNGNKQPLFQSELIAPSLGAASARVELGESEGRPVEVNVASSGRRILSSVALVGTFTGDGTEDLLLTVSPRQFAEVPGAADALPIRLSSGNIYIPNLSGNKPDLRIYISNFSNRGSDAHIAFYQVQGGRRVLVASMDLHVPGNGGAAYIKPLDEFQGQFVEAAVTLPSQRLKAALSVVKTYLADGGEETILYMSPEQWKRL